MTFRIVDTDNFGGDYPDEKFVGTDYATEAEAQKVANEMNDGHGDYSRRYRKVVEMPYKLAPGFTP